MPLLVAPVYVPKYTNTSRLPDVGRPPWPKAAIDNIAKTASFVRDTTLYTVPSRLQPAVYGHRCMMGQRRESDKWGSC